MGARLDDVDIAGMDNLTASSDRYRHLAGIRHSIIETLQETGSVRAAVSQERQHFHNINDVFDLMKMYDIKPSDDIDNDEETYFKLNANDPRALDSFVADLYVQIVEGVYDATNMGEGQFSARQSRIDKIMSSPSSLASSLASPADTVIASPLDYAPGSVMSSAWSSPTGGSNSLINAVGDILADVNTPMQETTGLRFGAPAMPDVDPVQVGRLGASFRDNSQPILVSGERMSGIFDGDDSAYMRLEELIRDDEGNQNNDTFDPESSSPISTEQRNNDFMRVRRVYDHILQSPTPKPIIVDMLRILYEPVRNNPRILDSLSSIQEMMLEIAKGVVVLNNKNRDMQPGHSMNYWLTKGPVGPNNRGVLNLSIKFEPPQRKQTINIDVPGQQLAAELYEKLDKATKSLGYNLENNFYMKLVKAGDGVDASTPVTEENVVKRSDRLGGIHVQKVFVRFVPKFCRILFVNYFDGREYPVTMPASIKTSKLYELAGAIVRKGVYPKLPEGLTLFRMMPGDPPRPHQKIEQDEPEIQPCDGHAQSKIYIVTQTKKDECYVHIVFGNQPLEAKHIITYPSKLDSSVTNTGMIDRLKDFAIQRGYIENTEEAKTKLKVYQAWGEDLPSNDEDFCKFHGDILLRLVSGVKPPSTLAKFSVGGNISRSIVLPLNTPLEKMYEYALRLLGVRFLPPEMLKRYLQTGQPPTIKQMESILQVRLKIGESEYTKAPNDNESGRPSFLKWAKDVQGAVGAVDGEVPIEVEFYTMKGSDWNSCVVQLVVGFYDAKYVGMNIPPQSMVVDSSYSYQQLYLDVQRFLARYLAAEDLAEIAISPSNDRDQIYDQFDSTNVCAGGSKHLMVHLKEQPTN